MVVKTYSSEETLLLGERLGLFLVAGDVLCLKGELGAGKTVFAKGVGRGLDVRDVVTSPTFTLINEYQGRLPFYHIDAYRLTGAEDMAGLGYEEYFYGFGVTLVEWAGQVAAALPDERLDITFEVDPRMDNVREVRFSPWGERFCRLIEELGKVVRSGN